MDLKKRTHRIVLVTLVMVFVLTGLFFLISNTITKYTGFSISSLIENDFEKCLKNQDITLFINSENPFETLNKIELKEYLEYFKIINCFRNNQMCLDNGIDSFPSWNVNGNIIKENISILKLKEITGCEI